MAVKIGELHGVPQVLELLGGVVYINDEPMPIKNVTVEEVEAFAAELDAVPQGDDPGYHALRCAKRVQFVVNLLPRAVGNECVGYLQRLMGFLHYDVLSYLGEVDDIEPLDEGEDHPVERIHDDGDAPRPHQHHHDGCGCGHDHGHQHDHDHGDGRQHEG